MEISEAIQKCTILNNASETIKESVQKNGQIVLQEKGVPIFRERERVDTLYFIVEGYVVLYRHNHRGDRKNIFIYTDGALLNEVIVEKPIASISAEPLCDTLVLKIPRKYFMDYMEDAAFSREVVYSSIKKIRKMYHQLANTSNSFRLEKQIIAKVWKLARDYGIETPSGIQIPFKVTITFLADMLGAKRESVSRVMGHLKKSNLIEYQEKLILVPDIDKLLKKIHEKE